MAKNTGLITRAEWLETVIKLTKAGIEEGDGNGLAKQAANYTNELKELKKNEAKSEKITPRRHTAHKRV